MKPILLHLCSLLLVMSCTQVPEGNPPQLADSDPDIIEIDYLYDVGDTSFYKGEYKEAIEIYLQALIKARASEHLKLQSYISNDIGLCYDYLGEFESALFYYEAAEKIDVIRMDTPALAGRWRNQSGIYRKLGLIDKSLELNLKAKDLLEKNYPVRTADVFNNLALIDSKEEDYEKSKENYKAALSIYEKFNREDKLPLIYNNLGYVFYELNDLDTADYYLNLCLRKVDTADFKLQMLLYENIGALQIKRGHLDSAKIYLNKSFHLANRYQNQFRLAQIQLTQATLAIEQSSLREALELIFKTLAYARQIESERLIMLSYQQLIDLYYAQNDFERAFNFQKELLDLKEGRYKNQLKKTAQLRHQYELRKETEQRLLAEENELLAVEEARRTQQLLVAIIIILMIFVIGIIIIISQRNSLSKLNKSLEESNRKIDTINKQNLHFTKNTLAGLVSMLNNQLKGIKEPKVKLIITEEKLRMETINILYQQLFQSPESTISAKFFVKSIVENTLSAMVHDEVDVDFQLADAQIKSEIAFPLGLLLNELVINAAKYALPENNYFLVSMIAQNENLQLKVKDQGAGFSEGFDWQKADSFGLRLIRLLAAELEAELEIISENGLCCSVVLRNI